MNGFYGNQSGVDFNIVKNYESAAAMLSDFSSVDCTVNFDEYVFLNDTGKIYRRSANLTNGQSGAEYIGQIQGYDGIAPFIDITNFTLADDEQFQRLIQAQDGIDSNKQRAKTNYIDIISTPPVEIINNQQINNDTIKYYYLIETNSNNEKNIKILLKIPYSAIKFNIQYIDSEHYNQPVRNDNINNSFIEEWTIQIPLIKNGNKLLGIYIVEKSDLEYINNQWTYNINKDNNLQHNLPIKSQTTESNISIPPSNYKKILLYHIATWDAVTAQYIDADYYYWGGEFYFKSLIYSDHNNIIDIPYWSGIGKVTENNNQKQLECYIPIKRTLHKSVNTIKLNDINILQGACHSQANAALKDIIIQSDIANNSLLDGTIVKVFFDNTNIRNEEYWDFRLKNTENNIIALYTLENINNNLITAGIANQISYYQITNEISNLTGYNKVKYLGTSLPLNFYINNSNDLTYSINTSGSGYVLIISNNNSLQTSWTLSNINLELHNSGMYFKLKGDISNDFPLSNYIDITLDNFSIIASHSEVI